MRKSLFSFAQVLLTVIVVLVAAAVLWRVVSYYMFAPWTRDGRVRADVVQVAPDVSGLVTRVNVTDNAPVTHGQVLFVIDQARYSLALQEARATAAQREATLAQARREYARNRTLGELVAHETLEESLSRMQQAQASVDEAQVAIGVAQLNLDRTVIASPVDGYLNDRAPRLGEFVTAGHAVLSVVDTASFHVDGYFEETKLRHIRLGQKATIELMGESIVLHGHVRSIAAGIEDRDRDQGRNLLPDVNPAFSWVRLAQRIPVGIALDDVPAGFLMIAGRTATVSIDPPGDQPHGGGR
ncbi:efflux RND transporter periplasmic adaptor subunit [Paraburkholderia sartisoli]|uniref:RND family efflux transporter, MFP subunit n=1 Tax=Paraburkholderia sartisoli TaxID=83784 RepID=A0A1H4CK98_9BURK|nr:efflux RND transporter periplasmic adaptor subunit [Paraburkholderia sartisoli]SEA60861.1 RND family efflux transporter, MFP subunit [Paraburkholderia sartisoli]